MGRRYDIWRCEFEEFVRLKQRWCELLEAEAKEEKESDSKTGEDRPPVSRASTPAASGDDATFAPEKVASRRQAVAEEKGGVVEQKLGRSEVAWKLEKGSQPFDVAAMTDLKRSDVELPYDASGAGVGARGVEFAVGTTRPRARGCRVVAAPLVRGQFRDVDKINGRRGRLRWPTGWSNFLGGRAPKWWPKGGHHMWEMSSGSW